MKIIKLSLCLSVVLLAPHFVFAALVGPYTPDANTVVLLHLDEAAGGSVTTNVGSLGGNFYSVNFSSSGANPPVVTTMLGVTGFSSPPTNFNNCESNTTAGYELGYDNNRDGAFEADNGGSGASADAIAMSALNIGNGGQTPFTLEALICPTNITANEEIICTDSGQGSRGFQFRITAGSLQFQFITGSQAATAAIPTVGSDAFVAGTWYHVAVVYDGVKATLYWTKLDPTLGAAHVLGTPASLTLGTSAGAVTGPLVIANRGRPTGTETFLGGIDEVRISSVARAANQMQFYSPFVTITQNPISQNVDYNQPVTFSVGASSLTSLGYQWFFNSNSIAGATNTSYVITNVAAGNAGFYSAVVTNTAGFAATSSPALLVVGAANFLNHRYSFTTSYTNSITTNTYVPDIIGGADGTNYGDAYVTNGALVLDGTSGTFMQLPGNLFNATNATALTVEFWATYGVNPNNVYVFGFGYTNFITGSGLVGIDYVTYTPHNASGNGLYISPSDSSFSQSVTNAGTLDSSTWHVACVIDPPDKILAIYTNGVLEAINTNMTVNLANVNDTLSFIGRSLFAADSYLNANIDELRIYNGALSGLSIQQSDAQGSNTVLADGPAHFVINPATNTVAPGLTATFTAAAVGYLPITYQWFTNGTLVPGATNTSYSLTAVSANTNAPITIVCQATNIIGVTTYVTNSKPAALIVVNPSTLAWLGQNSAAWDTSSLNWTNASTASLVAFSPFASATFDNRGAGQPAVNLTQALNPLAVTVNSTTDYSFISSGHNGSLTGPGTLTKANGNTLIIDVAGGLTGPVTISGGTLQVGNGDTLGAIGSPVTNNASLVFDRSDSTVMSSPIYGTGTVTMNAGNVTASGASYYTGNTFINSGVTFLGNATGLGATNGSITVADGAELYITANVDVGLNPLIIGGAGVSGAGALRKGGAGTTTYYGPVTLTETTTMNVDGGATLNLTNSAGIGATFISYLTLAGSGVGNITGPLSLQGGDITVSGGTWTVAPSNNFSGLITLYGGALRITGVQSLGPVPANFNASQITLNRGTLEAATNITLNDGKVGINVTDNSGITKDANATLTISNRISSINASVTLTNAGPGTLILNGANSFNGTLFMDTGSQTANDGMVVIANNAAIANIPAFTGTPFIIFRSQTSGSATLALDGTSGSITVAPDIQLSGHNVAAPAIENLAGDNTISGNFTLSAGGAYILQSDSGTLTLTQPWPYAPPPNVTTSRILTLTGAGIITMAGAIQDGSLLGTNVPVNILKSGSGILNLPVVNTYSGTTVVSNGVLLLATGGSIGTNTVTVAGGLLLGSGTIAGPVTVQTGGAIEAGATNTIGTLNLSSTLTLSGNTIVKINKNASTKDLFSGQTSVTYGGTLTVTNLAGTLTTNDTFTLFTSGASASNFANIVGSPGPGLKYTFANGVLGVAVGSKPAPRITSISLSGTTLTISGTNGAGGGQYVLLGSTNVALPLSQWTPLLTNFFDVSGNINLSTNIVNLALPLEFYLLSQ